MFITTYPAYYMSFWFFFFFVVFVSVCTYFWRLLHISCNDIVLINYFYHHIAASVFNKKTRKIIIICKSISIQKKQDTTHRKYEKSNYSKLKAFIQMLIQIYKYTSTINCTTKFGAAYLCKCIVLSNNTVPCCVFATVPHQIWRYLEFDIFRYHAQIYSSISYQNSAPSLSFHAIPRTRSQFDSYHIY